MRTSEQIDLISTALSAAQGEYGIIGKNKDNKFFGSKYAGLDDVLEACVPSLSKHGLALTQPISVADGRVVITTRLLHKSGQWIEECLSIRPAKDDAQSLGSAATYGRRYGAEAMLGVAATNDDDGESATRDKKEDKHKEDDEPFYVGSPEQQTKLRALTNELGIHDAAEIAQIHRSALGIQLDQIRAFVLKFKAAKK